eukprot:m.16058 g.16058  ORF g.16058 m.16058 type:complete len:335 (-) comp6808_c0_seq1:523-1527(-)
MHRVETKLGRPQQLHGLSKVLVDSAHNQPRCQAIYIAGTIDDGGPHDRELESWDGGKLLFGLQFEVCNASPRIRLAPLSAGGLVSSIHMGGGEFDKLLHIAASSLGGCQHRDLENVVTIHFVVLSTLCDARTVEHKVKFAIGVSECILHASLTREIRLKVLHVWRAQSGLESWGEIHGAWDLLVHHSHKRSQLAFHDIRQQMPPDKAHTSKHEHARFRSHDRSQTRRKTTVNLRKIKIYNREDNQVKKHPSMLRLILWTLDEHLRVDEAKNLLATQPGKGDSGGAEKTGKQDGESIHQTGFQWRPGQASSLLGPLLLPARIQCIKQRCTGLSPA